MKWTESEESVRLANLFNLVGFGYHEPKPNSSTSKLYLNPPESPMRSSFFFALSITVLFLAVDSVSAQLSTGWKAHDKQRPQAKIVTAGAKPGDPPSDAIVLFGESGDLSKWRAASGGEAKWKGSHRS